MPLNDSRWNPSILISKLFKFCIQWVKPSSPRMEGQTGGSLISCRTNYEQALFPRL